MIYLKYFETHSDYNTYITNNNKILPNVSYCEDNDECHYNPEIIIIAILDATFTVEDDSEETLIYGGMLSGISVLDSFSKIEVDDVEISLTDLDENYGSYQLSEGVHNIKYTLLSSLSISNCAFSECISLTNITIPNGVISIGTGAFNYTNITSINIPSSVIYIDIFLEGCSNITNITVDSNNPVYDSRNNCNAIIETSTNTLVAGCKNTIIPNTVTSIGDIAFASCYDMTSITIPNSVTSIGSWTFSECISLTTINIPNGVTEIGSGAFYDCYELTNITIPNAVTTIESNTFTCSGLINVTIGSGVTFIDEAAFSDLSSLESLTCLATTPPTLYDNAFINTENFQIYVPSESVNAYKAANGWSDYASNIQAIS